MKPYDIYLSFEPNSINNTDENEPVKLLFNTINSIGVGCWKQDSIAFVKCPVFICFINKFYIEKCKDELESANNSSKIILPVLTEKLKLSQSAIGHIINENDVKYYAAFKQNSFDWLSTLVSTIIDKFKRDISSDQLIKTNSLEIKTSSNYKQLNRLCKIGNVFMIADWELNAGIHILNANFEYVQRFNNNSKIKRATGICAIRNGYFVVVTSLPNTTDCSIYVFKIDFTPNGQIELAQVGEFNDLCSNNSTKRDLCGIVYHTETDLVLVVDRCNCSIIELSVQNLLNVNHNETYVEHVLYSMNSRSLIPKYLKKPVLCNIYLDKQHKFLYIIDTKSKTDGNNCVHKFEIYNKSLQWNGCFGILELKKPVAITFIEINNENLIVVLERSNPAQLHVYQNETNIYKNSITLKDAIHGSFIFTTNDNQLVITSLSNKLYFYNQEIIKDLKQADLEIDSIERFQKLFHIFISYNQHTAKEQALDLYDRLTKHGYNCWLDIKVSKIFKEKEIITGLMMVRMVICLLTNNYLVSDICKKEIETTFKEDKAVLLVTMEAINESNMNYLMNIKSKYKITRIYELHLGIIDKTNFKNEIFMIVNREFCKSDSLTLPKCVKIKQTIKENNFKLLNRLINIDNRVILVGDWELNVGIHILNINFKYIYTFNNNLKLIKVTGMCLVIQNRIAIVSSIPNTIENSIYLFEYKFDDNANRLIEFKQLHEQNELIYNGIKIERDLCAINYYEKTKSLYAIDRLNCTILQLDNELKSLKEYKLHQIIPKRFNKPILRDFKIISNLMLLTDAFSAKKHCGNNCIHVIDIDNIIWIKSIGEANIDSPSALYINKSDSNIFSILERTQPAYIKYFNQFDGKMVECLKLEQSIYFTNFIEINNKLFATNSQNDKISVYDSVATKSSSFCELI